MNRTISRLATFINRRYYSKSSLSEISPERIRNFSIIAHVDHGKSTLSDRILELAGVLSASSKNQQVLDRLAVERERGITVKAQTASFTYNHSGKEYLLNLIDTPGHVDFSYEVSRSLSACDGVVLVVDASQGIQAQTLAHACLALDMNLKVIPVLNKVDLPHADFDKTVSELRNVFGDFVELDDVLKISAKHGTNVGKVIDAIIDKIPSPKVNNGKDLQALLFDSWYDSYKGVISLVNIKQGCLEKGSVIKSCHSGKNYDVLQVGIVQPDLVERQKLYPGQIGYVVLNMKNPKEAFVGDTFVNQNSDLLPLPGFQTVQPMVYAGLYPVESSEFEHLNDAIDKLLLNDSSVSVQRTTSTALGLGFRLGFLGVLHMDVFKQRLEDEFKADIILTNPAVPYKLNYKDRESVIIENPCEIDVIDPKLESIEEPFVNARMMLPKEYVGALMSLTDRRRGRLIETDYLNEQRVIMKYELPLSEVAENQFFNELKQVTSGFASLDYDEPKFKESKISKLDVLLNGKQVDALSMITHSSTSQEKARKLATRLKDVIERQQFEIAIQVCVNGKPSARETIQAYRKDVTAKLYGGDQTRKRKLLDKQKEGKKFMKYIGKIELPKSAFMSIISTK